jgi:membrane protein DedA with SNARE-associated domain
MLEIANYLLGGFAELSVAALFIAFFFGTFVSEDAACLLAGAAAANGRISLSLAVLACFLGIFAGDVLLYATGRVIGARVFDNRFVSRFVSEKGRYAAAEWLRSNGAAAVFFTRFISGLRLPTYLAAGALRTDFKNFVFYFLAASAIWTPVLVGSTYFSQTYFFSKNALAGLAAMVFLVWTALKLSSWRNRRLLAGCMKRLMNWEFWPLTIFYAPVVLYIFLLAIKHRSLTVFTAANPAMPAGGFKGESKSDIYRNLQRSPSAAGHLLRFARISAQSKTDVKIDAALAFIRDNDLNFPIVLKPDAGERGRDVNIIRSESELRQFIGLADADLILQEFAPGPEFGIFYYRYPNSGRGHIFSITEKRFPTVTGDGVSDLEKLILKDPRAVCLAKKYLDQNRDRLQMIPNAGEEIELVEIGTHSRGAIFLDGGRLKTSVLEEKIDDICRGMEGFYFGRFDVRANSLDDLRRGENFRLIELNGVTSESTNIYDPRYSLFDAYRILFRQWRIAFEIASMNVEMGAGPTSLKTLIWAAAGLESSEI